MPMATETAEGQTTQGLTMTREPKGPTRAGDPGTVGDKALMDAVTIIIVCWALLFMLSWSLRAHNI